MIMNENSRKKRKDSLILIVDDVPENIQLLGKILDKNGYGVVAVTSGDQVLKAARKHKPDLILLDIMMPEKSGYEVCEELKADAGLSETPVIFLTARSEEEDIVKGLNLGGADYVIKPFNRGELLARIDIHLSLKKARDKIITQNKELEQLTATKEKLYSIIAHDLRGALSGISGLAEVVSQEIQDQPVNDDLKFYIMLISNSAKSSTQLLVNLFSWARLQTGDLRLNPEKVSIFDVIKDGIHLYKTMADNKQIEIHFQSEDIQEEIVADKQMISTVVRNLISNAIKFSHEGDHITIAAARLNGNIRLSVRDEGEGMTEDVKKNLFDPENRPARRGTNNEGGTGLGLLLCKEFVEAHNGQIMVKTEPGRGSEFSCILPQDVTGQSGNRLQVV
jgi:two-component system, sensor histidine kinase and response regulator